MQTAQKNFHKKLLGRAGENVAVKYLKKAGYKILEKNFSTHIGEIDIIAEKDGYTVFAEVKTRSGYTYGAPSEAVDENKRRKYALVATEYLVKAGKTDTSCRFDVIEIAEGRINHIIDAFGV